MSNLTYLQWHITHKCNNRCKHCYQNSYNGNETNAQTARLIIDDFADFCKILGTSPSIAITGGDPLINPDFFAILNMAKEICSEVGILGNPEKLDTRTICQLKSSGISYYQLSIDGLKKTHDAIRSDGSFQKTIGAIQRLKKERIKVSVMSTISSLNINEMEQVMRLAYSLGASNWYFSRYMPRQGDCGINAHDYMVFLGDILKKHHEFEKTCGAMPLKKEPLLTLLTLKEIDPSPQIKSGCSLGTSSLTLLPDNTIMACRRHPDSILGKWTAEKTFIKHFLFNPKMKGYRQIGEIEGCKNCKFLYYCRGCRAAAFVATGNSNSRDPQCPIAETNEERR